jgi:RNA polymerase sigma-70 factor, ECF subfamily
MTQSHGNALRLASAGMMTGAAADRPTELAADVDAHAAFVDIYRELLGPVYGFIHFRVRDTHTAEDLTAQAFERAFSHFSGLRDHERVRAWVFSIARNVIADHQRSRRANEQVSDDEQVAAQSVQSPEQDAVRHEDWQRLDRYLAELGDRDREVIGLRYAAGLSHREIGNLLSMSESNVAQVVHRVVLKLRTRFAQDEVQQQ